MSNAMLFDYDLVVPAGTAQDAPAVGFAHLSSGTLTEIRVKFPPGPATLVHVVVKDGTFQLMPLNPDGTLNVDDIDVLSGQMDYPLQSPYTLTMLGWSPDAVFDHTITFQFDVQPPKPDQWQQFVSDLLFQAGPRPKAH
jgi:hypothetical protein